MEKIAGFFKEYRFLSNFHLAPVEMYDVVYPATENAYQAAKTLNPLERLPFQVCSPKEAKQLGKNLSLRPGWNEMRETYMLALNWRKYFGNAKVGQMLLATGDVYLEETNYWHDNFWGCCTCAACGNRGQNKLGNILMTIRNDLREKNEQR